MVKIVQKRQLYIEKINKRLDELVGGCSYPQASLLHTARYTLLLPAKRLRPLLFLLTCDAYHVPLEKSLDLACSIEMIHTYSLLHDDLPCMDNDLFRRGKKTAHQVFGEAHAILAGDFLLTYAFEIISKQNIEPTKLLKIIRILSNRLGAFGMVGGQTIDIQSEGKHLSWKELEYMHLLKTGAFFTACFETAATLGDSTEADMQILQKIGTHLGLAFQILDDLADLTLPFSEEKKNKQKPTAITVLTIDHAKKVAIRHLEIAKGELKKLSISCTELENILEQVSQRVTI